MPQGFGFSLPNPSALYWHGKQQPQRLVVVVQDKFRVLCDNWKP
ncbi:MAG TPA: hypothetical protein V6D19_20550 [Stenomitos sp.]